MSQNAEENVRAAANCLVQLILSRTDNNRALRRRDLQKHVKVTHPNVNFRNVFTAAGKLLHSVYGYDLCASPGGAANNDKYFIRSWIPRLQQQTTSSTSPANDLRRSVTFVLLAHVFLSGGTASESSIGNLLRQLHVDDAVHELCKRLQTAELLEAVREEEKTMFKWGAQAELFASKLEMLKLLQRIYGRDAVPQYNKLHSTALLQEHVDDESAATTSQDTSSC